MPRLLIGLAVVLVIITVYALVDCSLLPRERVRGLPRWAWVLVILLVPVIGPVLWLIVGRGGRAGRANARRGTRTSAPDDDPDFLKGLGRRMSEEEHIRKLEQELADLDKNEEHGGKPGSAGSQGVPPKKNDPGEGELPGRRDA
ncbi:MAG TPA: PLDc N-terminal domain-containing protein [Glaciibacter sp.]|nr:PLDc N-terminal domain-containing protein [Glaciibacter sp.]